MNEYLLRIRSIVDHLALVDNKLSNREHTNAIVDGLNLDYETFVLSIDTRKEPFTVDEIESLLLAQEARIERKLSSHSCMDNSMANLTQFTSRGRQFYPNFGGRFNLSNREGYQGG